MTGLAVVAIAFGASLFMAWTIGANSNSAPFAPAVGANALPVMRAALFVGVFSSLGAFLQGGAISETIGGALIRGVTVSPLAAAAALLTAASLILLGNRRGYPMPSAFTVTGAVIGVGLALGGAPATGKYVEIATFWLLIPVVAAAIGFGTATLLRHERVPEGIGVPVLAGLTGLVIANMRISLLPSPTGGDATVADWIARGAAVGRPELLGRDPVAILVGLAFAGAFFVAIRRIVRRDTEEGVRTFLVILGSFVVFSSGGSQVGLATGPLESLFRTTLDLPVQYLIGAGSLAILAGGVLGAPRVVQAVSREYSKLGIRRSISALVPAFLITQTAITLGLPISMNQTVIASLIGSGLVEGSAGVSSGKVGYTVLFWLLSLVVSSAIAAGLYRVFAAAVGTA